MELPIELRSLIEEKLEKSNIKELKENSERISLKYREKSGKGNSLVTEEIEALAYAAVRMPATYGAVSTALKNTFEILDQKIESVLDVGAGTGAGTWAIRNFIDLKNAICLEREDVMRNLGKSLMLEADIDELQNVKWENFDLVTSDINYNADLVICSYVLNELNDENRMIALDKLWKATNKVLLIIEPGTPKAFSELRDLRAKIIENGGNVIAPCPNNEKCKLSGDDWCHATCRVARTKIHKILKNGDVPYEDEKFSYIAVTKDNVERREISRVLRHPKIESGRIVLQICNNEGISEKVITKKNKEMFKIARKVNCGDAIEIK